MGIYNFFKNVYKQTRELRVWCLYLKSLQGAELLHMCLAYDLEEAVGHAWNFLKEKCDNKAPMEYTPKMWLSMSVDEISKEMFASEMKEIKKTLEPPANDGPSETSKLINEIIKNEDNKLFQRSKKKLTEYEIKYIEEKLKK